MFYAAFSSSANYLAGKTEGYLTRGFVYSAGISSEIFIKTIIRASMHPGLRPDGHPREKQPRTFQLWCPSVTGGSKPVVNSVLVDLPSFGSIEEELASQSRFKTELCRKFMLTGTCQFGDRCSFAHSPEELRPVLRHPKYKTVPCRHWVSAGKVCCFLHS